MPCHTRDISVGFPPCGVSCAHTVIQGKEMPRHTRHICMAFLACAPSCDLLEIQRN